MQVLLAFTPIHVKLSMDNVITSILLFKSSFARYNQASYRRTWIDVCKNTMILSPIDYNFPQHL